MEKTMIFVQFSMLQRIQVLVSNSCNRFFFILNQRKEETEANNQLIIDDTTVQKLTQEEVLRLKAEGLKGTLNTEEIINKMVAAHSEFDKKTEFSKAKYIERKKKK